MARKSEGFNVTAAVREYRERHPAGSAREAFEAIKKAHPKEKLNENSLKTTFYKLAGGVRKKNGPAPEAWAGRCDRRRQSRRVHHAGRSHFYLLSALLVASRMPESALSAWRN
jgi:hypothetical protein